MKRRDRAHERVVIEATRQEVSYRDGRCRLERVLAASAAAREALGPHDGWPEWAHLGERKRFKTRGQAAEARHTTADTAMLCSAHHRSARGYDGGAFAVEYLSADGADGRVRIALPDGRFFDEPLTDS